MRASKQDKREGVDLAQADEKSERANRTEGMELIWLKQIRNQSERTGYGEKGL